ncbi:MAG: response regulator transcription factor [Solirubrobacteraceae bacterium]|nr:response regulator transcription factor [Patulibacter sp.]
MSGVPIRVVIADDQAIIREGLSTLLDLVEDIEVVGLAADGREAIAAAAEHAPDVVLMDLRMPHVDGAEATRTIRAAQPAVEVVVLTTYADDASIFGALQAGARGYLTKDAGVREISRAIHAAAAGQALLDPAVQAKLLAAASGTGPSPAPAAAGPDGTSERTAPAPAPPVTSSASAPVAAQTAGEPRELPDGLTAREAEVLGLIAGGLSNGEIAGRLVVSEATVKSHINHLFAKIGARDRAQAVHYAYERGLTGDR